MRIRMLRDRDYTPKEERRVTMAYTAASEVTIKREWGDELVAAGDAVEIDAPGRDPLDHDGNGRKGGARKAEADAVSG